MNRKIILALPIALGDSRWGQADHPRRIFVLNRDFETSTNSVSTLLSHPDTSVTGWTNNGTFVLYCTAGAGTTCNSQPSLGGFQLAGPGNGHNNGLTSSPQGGAYVAFNFDPAFAGAFSQTIAGLTVGDSYTLSFYAGGAQEIFGGAPPTTRSITATLGNETFSDSDYRHTWPRVLPVGAFLDDIHLYRRG